MLFFKKYNRRSRVALNFEINKSNKNKNAKAIDWIRAIKKIDWPNLTECAIFSMYAINLFPHKGTLIHFQVITRTLKLAKDCQETKQ